MSEENLPNPAPNQNQATPVNNVSPITGETFDPTFKELGPNDKRTPRKIPVLKIILSILILGIFLAILASGIYYVKHQDKYLKVAQPAANQVVAILSPYPAPQSNICGNDAKICPGGDVTTKQGIKCEFISCPDNSSDMTKFWKIDESFEQQNRTYENLDLKYNFTAPSNWKFIGNDQGFILYSPNFTCKTTNDCVGSAIQLASSLTTGKTDIEEWYKSDENIIAKNSGKDPAKLSNYEVTNVAGVKAVSTNDRQNAKTLYFINDNVVYVLSLKSSSDNDFINGSKAYDALVASFKFNNPKPTN